MDLIDLIEEELTKVESKMSVVCIQTKPDEYLKYLDFVYVIPDNDMQSLSINPEKKDEAEEAWNILKKETQTLKTFKTKTKREFEVVCTDNRIRCTPKSSGKPRPLIKEEEFKTIMRMEIEKPWDERFKPINYRRVSVNASYILALISFILKLRK